MAIIRDRASERNACQMEILVCRYDYDPSDEDNAYCSVELQVTFSAGSAFPTLTAKMSWTASCVERVMNQLEHVSAESETNIFAADPGLFILAYPTYGSEGQAHYCLVCMLEQGQNAGPSLLLRVSLDEMKRFVHQWRAEFSSVKESAQKSYHQESEDE